MTLRTTGEIAQPTVEDLYRIAAEIRGCEGIRQGLDNLLPLLRSLLIFDLFAVFTADPLSQQLEIAFARAVGRGQSREADLVWGEPVAAQVMDEARPVLSLPAEEGGADRITTSLVLGVPLLAGEQVLGALILIRFGGPEFLAEDIRLAEYCASQIAILLEKDNLEDARQMLESQHKESRLRDDFVSTITHELRTPLGFIKGYTTTLLRKDTQWSPEEQHEFLTIIDQEADHLQELIGNLLDSARLQSGHLQINKGTIQLDSLIRGEAERVAIHNPGFTCRIAAPAGIPPLQGDPTRLAQVFGNLFINATKYAPGSPVEVSIRAEGKLCTISIKDKGPGIPHRYLGHIFDRFFRNPESSLATSGTGLGLYICRKIIQAHQGTIEAESQPGEGTSFIIHLPLE